MNRPALLLLSGILVLSSGYQSSPVRGPGGVISAYFNRLTRERRAASGRVFPRASSAPPRAVEPLSPADLFIAVKTTGRYHRSRLELLLETWMGRNMAQTFVFTDTKDSRLKERLGDHLVQTDCSEAHSRQALSCKMSREFQSFISAGNRWFCHVDDDNYVNVDALLNLLSQFHHSEEVYVGRPSIDRPLQAPPLTGNHTRKRAEFWFATGGAGFCLSRGLALKMSPWVSGGAFRDLSDLIGLPDDCTVGYIVEAVLGYRLTLSPLFHSHLENLGLLSDLHKQVTLSYGPEQSKNTVKIRGLPPHQDPNRFRSVHCLLHPDTPWCPVSPLRFYNQRGGGATAREEELVEVQEELHTSASEELRKDQS